MMLRRIFVLSVLGVLAVACGGSDDSSGGGGSGGGAGTGTGGGAGMGTGGAGGSTTKTCPSPYGTFVVVGDSISDVGSGTNLPAQQPFYRDLLVQNDDGLYPDWQGKDLTTCWGSVNVLKVSKGGAKTPDLVNQVKGLPASLPGPVLVVGTIGGNDVQAALPDVLLGQDVSNQLAAFTKNIDDTFAELTKPDRFGPGVQVQVLLTNVYDPSGGTGDFSFSSGSKCPGLLSAFPTGTKTDPLLQPWNDAMQTEADKYPNVELLDLHADFYDHAVNKPDTWWFVDCIHPNTAGHEAIRELFWPAMVAAP